MVVQDSDGNVLVATNTNTHWLASNASAITADSVYNGETYDARIEQRGWSQPGFQPSTDWKPAAPVTCFAPTLSPRPFPAITVMKETPAVSITPVSSCPKNMLGGMVQENAVLTLQCAAGTGTISSIAFADFGTPSGTCGNYTHGSCTTASAAATVAKLCAGKTSCAVNASNAVFGSDPCYGTAKSLAVTGVGCTDNAPSKLVVDFGENLSGVTRVHLQGAAGTTVTLRHAEVLQHPPYGPADGNIYTGNLRTALATDTYILKGDAGGETYMPSFTCVLLGAKGLGRGGHHGFVLWGRVRVSVSVCQRDEERKGHRMCRYRRVFT